MDWLRKLRGRVQGFREGQGQTQSHSDAGRAGDGTQESCLLPPSPQTPFIPSVSIHPFCSLLLPQHQPAYLCSGIPPTLEPASSRKLSKSPHWSGGGLPPWRPSQAKRPHAAWSCMEEHPSHLKKSTAMSRSSSRTTANLAS